MNNLEFFTNRASVRAFDPDRHVSEELLDKLLYAASHAPSTGNMQLYTVIVTRDPERKAHLAHRHLDQPAARNCDVMLTVCADVHRFDLWCKARKALSGLNNPGGRMSAIEDASIFAQQFITAAEMNGLGCCYLGSAAYDMAGFTEALRLPKGVIPLFGIAVGWPSAVGTPSDRLPLDAIVSREVYHEPTLADIDSYYAEKENLEESAKYIAENNKETLAQVYADVRYPRERNERTGVELLKFLSASDDD